MAEPQLADCAYEEEGHRYSIGGLTVPSVTQVIETGFPYRGRDSEAREYAARLGTYVHEACALYSAGTLDESTLSAPLVPYVEGWKRLLATGRVEVLATEQRRWHLRRRFAGTYDALVKFDGREVLWDIKTGRELTPQMGIQLAGYLELENNHRETGRPVLHRAVVHLTDQGEYQLVPYEDPADLAAFYALLTLYNWGLKHAAA